MSDLIKTQLLKKAHANELHNVYLIEPNKTGTTDKGELLNWTTDFLQSFLQSSGKSTSIENHQDILLITPEEKKKYYGQDSIEQIFKFLNYKASELQRKFLIISNADKLSEISANKLLKTFEEPPIPLTIFLLNPLLFEILPTISSRCINLNITLESKIQNVYDPIWPISFTDFSAKLASGETSYLEVASYILDKAQSSPSATIQSLSDIQSALKELDQDILYNGPVQGRAFRLYSCLEKLAE